MYVGGGTARIDHSTFVGNSAAGGGGDLGAKAWGITADSAAAKSPIRSSLATTLTTVPMGASRRWAIT